MSDAPPEPERRHAITLVLVLTPSERATIRAAATAAGSGRTATWARATLLEAAGRLLGGAS